LGATVSGVRCLERGSVAFRGCGKVVRRGGGVVEGRKCGRVWGVGCSVEEIRAQENVLRMRTSQPEREKAIYIGTTIGIGRKGPLTQHLMRSESEDKRRDTVYVKQGQAQWNRS